MFAKTLYSERIKTCPMNEVDFDTYLGWLNDREITRFLTTVRNGISYEDAKEYIKRVDASNNEVQFALIDRVTGKFIGTAHVVADWETGTAYWGSMIGEKSYWGKGYGTEIKGLLAYYIFSILLLKKIDTRPEPKHIASVKTIERNGFRKVGKSTDKFGEPVDIYELTSEEYFKMHSADKLGVLNGHITQ